MPKPKTLTGDELNVAPIRPLAATRQRGVTPSAQYVPLQFRLRKETVKRFKLAALHRDMKLNQMLEFIFEEYMKNEKAGKQ